MIAFFYRAWASNQQTVSADRSSPEHDRFSRYFGSLFGIGMSSLRNRDAVPDMAKIHYSGHLAGRTRHAEGLRALVSDFFRIPVQIVQLVGQWLPLPENCRCRLGQTPDTGTLGMTAIVGAQIWDCQQKFRIRMGPMRLDDYERMLPAGQSLRRLQAWVRNYVGDELDWDVQLVLLAQEVPAIQLGRIGRLGWTTWLRSQPFASDADDLVLGGAAWQSTNYGSQ
jgi:type VI secretion system protein ImpH